MADRLVWFYFNRRYIVHDGDVGYMRVVCHMTALRTSHTLYVAALVIQTALTECVATADEESRLPLTAGGVLFLTHGAHQHGSSIGVESMYDDMPHTLSVHSTHLVRDQTLQGTLLKKL